MRSSHKQQQKKKKTMCFATQCCVTRMSRVNTYSVGRTRVCRTFDDKQSSLSDVILVPMYYIIFVPSTR